MQNDNRPKQQVSLIASMATRYGMDPRKFMDVVLQTCMPAKVTPSQEQFAAFLLMANQLGLNPVAREIYAAASKRGSGIQIIVGVDGWISLINRHPQMDGVNFSFEWSDKQELLSCTCRIFRKDRSRPIEVTEYFRECVQPTEVWRLWPVRMMRHKTLIQCARVAFGISGVMEPDEYERMVPVGDEPAVPQQAQVEPPRREAEPLVIPPPPAETSKGEAPGAAMDPLDYDAETGEVFDEANPRPAGPGLISEWRQRIHDGTYNEALDLFQREIYPAEEEGKISRAEREDLQGMVLDKGDWRQ
jgi:phage recombination protein Bet